MPTIRAAQMYGQERRLHTCLFVVAAVLWFGMFRGLTSIEDMSGGTFVARASASVIATGMSVGVYLFWTYAFAALPRLRTGAAKLYVLAVLALGLLFIIGASAYLAATGLAGHQAQLRAESDSIATFERATAARYDASLRQSSFETDLNLLIGKLTSDRDAEFASGAISGSAKHGAVYFALERMVGLLTELRRAVQKHRSDAEGILAAAQQDLQAMREISGKDFPTAQRMKQLRAKADALRAKLSRLDGAALNASLIRTADALPHEVEGIAFKLSSDPKVARNQKDALERLHAQAADMARQLKELGEQLPATGVEPIPEFRPLTAMAAVAKYALEFWPAWMTAIFLELVPLFPLLILMFGAGERTRTDELGCDLANVTVQELAQAKLAGRLLQGELDPKTLRALNAALLGQEIK